MGNKNSKKTTEKDANTSESANGLININLASGIGPTPLPVRRFKMPTELLEMLQSSTAFDNNTRAETESREATDVAGGQTMEELGFQRCRDPGHPIGHVYYEGYFHGQRTCEALPNSVNPRYGSTMDKPPAPLALRALLEAFRTKTQDALTNFLNSSGLVTSCEDGEGEDIVPLDCLFADIAAQSHHGEAVPITRAHPTGWHTDAFNSLLHMTISVRGRRILHAVDSVHDEELTFEMAEGDVYITSPANFEHAVEYPACSWDTRILAVQCRILFDANNYDLLYKKNRSRELDVEGEISRLVCEFLSHEENVVFPSTDEVLAAMEKLSEEQT